MSGPQSIISTSYQTAVIKSYKTTAASRQAEETVVMVVKDKERGTDHFTTMIVTTKHIWGNHLL